MKKFFVGVLMLLAGVAVMGQSVDYGSGKSKHLDSLSKSDMNGLKRTWDEFKMQYVIETKDRPFVILSPYIVIKMGNNMHVGISANYRSSGWIFMDRMAVSVDGEIFEFKFTGDVSRDVFSGSTVKEWVTQPATPEIMEVLRKIAASSGDVKVRLEGEKFYDKKLSHKQVEDIRKILSIYDKLKVG